jgi:hypothetical protein
VVRSVNGGSVPEPGEGGAAARDGDAAGGGWETPEWRAAARRARVPDREDFEDAGDAAVAEDGPELVEVEVGPAVDVEPVEAGVPGHESSSEDLANADRGIPSPGDEAGDLSDEPAAPGDRVASDMPDDVGTDVGSEPDGGDGGDRAVTDDGSGRDQSGDDLRASDVRRWVDAAGEAAGAQARQEAARRDQDRAEVLRLYEVVVESVRTDTRLADVRVGLRVRERVPHDYFRPQPPPGLVEQGMDRAWARKDGDGVRLVLSPSVEQAQFTPGLNPVADPYTVKVRDSDGRVVWSGPVAVDADAPGRPRLRSGTEQVAEVATSVFRDAAGVASGGVSDLPVVEYLVDKVTEGIGTDRGRVAVDRVTDIPVPAERFTRDGYTLSVEKPAHADAYARGNGGAVRDLHVRTVREMAREGAVTAEESRVLTTELQRLPWEWQSAPEAKPEDHWRVHGLLAEDGLRTWVNDKQREMRNVRKGE